MVGKTLKNDVVHILKASLAIVDGKVLCPGAYQESPTLPEVVGESLKFGGNCTT